MGGSGLSEKKTSEVVEAYSSGTSGLQVFLARHLFSFKVQC